MMASEQDQLEEESFPDATDSHDSLGDGLGYIHISDDQCTCCRKRRSPSPYAEPYPKKPMLLHSSPRHSRSDQETHNPFPGFTKVPLPFPVFTTSTAANAPAKTDLSSASSPPIPELYRSASDPFRYPVLNEMTNDGSAPLRRSVSDPICSPEVASDFNKIKKDDTSPGARSLPRVRRRSTGSQISMQTKKSPNSSRLKSMKERMREMSQLWDEVIQEQEEEELEEPEEEDGINNSTISKQDVSGTGREEEVVGVERIKDGFNIKFKCPCGKGYHILVCDRNCYYKLL